MKNFTFAVLLALVGSVIISAAQVGSACSRSRHSI